MRLLIPLTLSRRAGRCFGVALALAGGLLPDAAVPQAPFKISEDVRAKLEAATVLVQMSCKETLTGHIAEFDPALVTAKKRYSYASGSFIHPTGKVLTAFHTFEELMKAETRTASGQTYTAECPANSITIAFFEATAAGIARAKRGGQGDFVDIVAARDRTFESYDAFFLQADLSGTRHDYLCAARKLSLDEHDALPIIGAGIRIENDIPLFDIMAGYATNQFGAGDASTFLKMTLPSIYGLSGGPIVGTDAGLVGIYQGVSLTQNPGHTANHFSPALRFYSALEAIGAICPENEPNLRLSMVRAGASSILTVVVTDLPEGTEIGAVDLQIVDAPQITQSHGQPASRILTREVQCMIDVDKLAIGAVERIRLTVDALADTNDDRLLVRTDFGLTARGRSVELVVKPVLRDLFDQEILIKPVAPFRLKIKRDSEDDPQLSTDRATCLLLDH